MDKGFLLIFIFIIAFFGMIIYIMLDSNLSVRHVMIYLFKIVSNRFVVLKLIIMKLIRII